MFIPLVNQVKREKVGSAAWIRDPVQPLVGYVSSYTKRQMALPLCALVVFAAEENNSSSLEMEGVDH